MLGEWRCGYDLNRRLRITRMPSSESRIVTSFDLLLLEVRIRSVRRKRIWHSGSFAVSGLRDVLPILVRRRGVRIG